MYKKWLDWSFGFCSVAFLFGFVSHMKDLDLMPVFLEISYVYFVQVVSGCVEVSCLICDFEICHLLVKKVD